MSSFYVRWQRNTIEKALKTRRVLLLWGARQCGKTTLAKELVSEGTTCRTLDDPSVRQIAETDPRGFVKHAGKTLIIVVERVRPLKRTDYAWTGQRPKLFMTGAGLMSSVLGWDRQRIHMDADRSGKPIETFMFNEIAAQVDAHTGRYSLFHYRDREKREIDFLIERGDWALLGIEIKAGSAIGTNDFRNLSWFKKNIARDRQFTGIVLYSGDIAGSMGNGLWAIPFGTIWNRA